MCLAVVNDFQIKTVESPITVYKEASYNRMYQTATSKYQFFKYKRGEIVTCSAPFLIVYRDDPSSFYVYDSKEAIVVNEYFGENQNVAATFRLRQLWFNNHFELIQTGFHFCFGDKTQTRDISRMWEFLIPVGARIVVGIDNTLGVTDQIMLV